MDIKVGDVYDTGLTKITIIKITDTYFFYRPKNVDYTFKGSIPSLEEDIRIGYAKLSPESANKRLIYKLLNE